ncbi:MULTISPECIES: APC family permease [Kocuria]|uniref:APC family permease n=1 Tax=Kocuria subflava TaxID=1736139 RepID=A0A846TIF2_9MICC|nr:MULTISPECIES: APC family permease [unclassified Kocuria]NKE08938.1 APC family permease [Kocuria subflava]
MAVNLFHAVRTTLVGRPLHNARFADTALSKRTGLPVFSADALSSVAYAPDEIVLTLALAGVAAVAISPWVGLAVVLVMAVVVAAYRQNVRAYPSGGGDFEIASKNVGRKAGVVVGAALMVDFTLVVAVSMSAAAQYLAAAFPSLIDHRTAVALVGIVVAGLLNLRGLRFMGRATVVPTYVFITVMLVLIGTGLVESRTGSLDPAPSAAWEVLPAGGSDTVWTTLGMIMLILRAFSSGAVAVTGVESVSGSVQYLKKPRAANAATILTIMGVISAVLLMGVMYLVQRTGAVVVLDPATQLRINGHAPEEHFYQNPLLGQLARAVFGLETPMFYVVIGATVLVLMVAASTAFSGFPALGSRLARDSFLPRQLKARGDRFAFTNGIIALLVAAAVLVVVFRANVNDLVQLYVVGVFTSFTVTQAGMVRHWKRQRRNVHQPQQRRRLVGPAVLACVALVFSATVLVIVLVTKFAQGAWITLLAMAVLGGLMLAIRKHYDAVDRELVLAKNSSARALPSRVHAMIIVPSVRKPTMRALAYARASRPSTLEALVVDVSPAVTSRILEDWQRLEVPVPVTVLDAPYRNSVQPVIDHLHRVRRRSPRDLVVVYIPEYVVGSWWERVLHNQSTAALAHRLRLEPGVMIASVPWHVDSHAADRPASTSTENT